MVPAIDSANYLTPITNKRKIIPKSRPNSESSNIVEKFCINHSSCFKTKNPKTQQYKNSFFVKTIHDWNALDNIAICANTVKSFKSALTGRDWPDSTPGPDALRQQWFQRRTDTLYRYRYRYNNYTQYTCIITDGVSVMVNWLLVNLKW